MHVIDWIRSKAAPLPIEFLTVTEAESSADCAVGTYRIETFVFRGTVPFRMKGELRATGAGRLERNAAVHELLSLGGAGGKSESCKVEFYRSVCTRVAS